MSLLERGNTRLAPLDTVEPDSWLNGAPGNPLYGRSKVESMLSQCRKEALLEAVEVCKTIANDAEDCGATPEMLEIVYAVEDELRRMAEGEK